VKASRIFKRDRLGRFSKMAMSAKRFKKRAKRNRWPRGMPLPRVTNQTDYNTVSGVKTYIR
jgi:hypothetical protein